MPTNHNSIEPNGSTFPHRGEIRKRLQGLLTDLDILGEDLAAVHVQAALDCFGKDLGVEDVP